MQKNFNIEALNALANTLLFDTELDLVTSLFSLKNDNVFEIEIKRKARRFIGKILDKELKNILNQVKKEKK